MIKRCLLGLAGSVVFFGFLPKYFDSVNTLASASMQGELQTSISHVARSIQPGEVVLLSVETSRPVTAVQGIAFGTSFHFYQTENELVWNGLIGIDLTVEPGTYFIELQVEKDESLTIENQYNLTVMPKIFGTRRLTVDPGYVIPPTAVIDRIHRESQRLSEIFQNINSEKLWGGSFQRPVLGEATSSFGRRSVLNGQERSPHSGTDFRASEGTPIEAPNWGRVVLSKNLYYSGNCVILDHGLGLYSYFAHLSRIGVSEGDTVAPGQVIGEVGATGRVTGPHLHWTVRLNGARVDPLSLIAVFSP